jgi:hypothetical protein
MTVVKRGTKYVLVDSKGHVLGTHDSRTRAEAQENAINISKARKAGHPIPKKKGSR